MEMSDDDNQSDKIATKRAKMDNENLKVNLFNQFFVNRTMNNLIIFNDLNFRRKMIAYDVN